MYIICIIIQKSNSFDCDNDKKEDNNTDDGNIDESDTIYIDNANKIEIVWPE